MYRKFYLKNFKQFDFLTETKGDSFMLFLPDQ